MHNSLKIIRPVQIKLMVLFTTLVLSSAHLFAGDPSMQFKSSFDDGVSYVGEGRAYHHLQGTDSVSGFNFPNDLPGKNWLEPDSTAVDSFFAYSVSPSKVADGTYTQYVKTRIDTVIGPEGKLVKALYQEFIKDDPDYVSLSRNSWSLNSRQESLSSIDRLDDLYITYYIKQHLTSEGSTYQLFMEMKTFKKDVGNTYRWGVYMYNATTTPYWYMKGEDYSNWGTPEWPKINKEIPVYQDKWFKVELYWKNRTQEECDAGDVGTVQFAINNKLVFEHHGRTKKDKTSVMWPFKIYGNKGWHWITDFEIWDKPPITSILNPEYTPKSTQSIFTITPGEPGELK